MQETGLPEQTAMQKARSYLPLLPLTLPALLVRLELLLPPFWQILLSFGFLLVSAVAYMLLWLFPPARLGRVYPVILSAFVLVSMPAPILLAAALFNIYNLATSGLDFISTAAIAVFIYAVVGVILGTLLYRRDRRREGDVMKTKPPEVKAALERIKEGWGTSLEDALKQGVFMICMGPAGGIFSSFGLLLGLTELFSLHQLWGMQITGLPEGQLSKIVFLAGSLLMLILGLWALIYTPVLGWRILRFWRKLHNDPQRGITFTIQGTIADKWSVAQGAQGSLLVKVQPRTGSSKLLVVKPPLVDSLPNDDKEEVRIEYLFGTEAVVSIKTLAKI
ncbi:MAG TPA: hypothetical protein VFU32_07200 [Ktedonobacterales bacterium]|nr:hypothetical protein [Ktedonobacterales bacterium]